MSTRFCRCEGTKGSEKEAATANLQAGRDTVTRDAISYRTKYKGLVTQELKAAQWWSVGHQEVMPAWRDLEGAGQVPATVRK